MNAVDCLGPMVLLFTCGSLMLPSQADNGGCSSASVSEIALVNYIFANNSRQVRPVFNSSKSLVVNIGIRLYGIKDFLERQHTLILEGYFTVNWIAETFRWDNVYPYNCLDLIVLNTDQMWVPDFIFVNGDSEMFALKGRKVNLYSSGSSTVYPTGEIAVKCDLDLTWFPFDMQICQIVVQSWSYPSSQLTMKLHKSPFPKIDHLWTENGQWELVKNKSAATNDRFVTAVTYDHVDYIMLLRRKSLFYFINVIIPGVIIALAELATFMLPVDEVIKVHISFTCLLAYSVFQTMIIGDMPKSSETAPLLSLYIDLQMAYIGVIALLGEGVVFSILRRASNADNSPPEIVLKFAALLGKLLLLEERRKFIDVSNTVVEPSMMNLGDIKFGSARSLFFEPTGYRPLFVEYNSDSNGLPPSYKNSNQSEAESKQRTRSRRRSEAGDRNSGDSAYKDWRFVAAVVQRLNLCLYIASIIITPAVMFTMAPSSGQKDLL